MIKRFRKFKQSKQGAILVFVVLILALAMIFIASAMMLTQATRTRLYRSAVSSQARLTVTTAAEVFIEALDTQEITDTQLDNMLAAAGANRHPDLDDRIKMVIDDNTVPGMAGVEGNCTYLDLYYPDYPNKDTVYADFTTVIGEETENVQVQLKVASIDPSYGNRFSNQIDINSNVDIHQLFFRNGVGMTTLNVTDNTLLFRGNNVTETATGSVIFSDCIFTGTCHFSAGGNKYYGNMIFLDGAVLKGGATFGGAYGDFYFISKSDSGDPGIQWGEAGFWKPEVFDSSVDFIFNGRSIENETSAQQHVGEVFTDTVDGNPKHNCYFIDSDGNAVGDTYTGKFGTNSVGSFTNGEFTVSNAANGSTYGATGDTVKDELKTNLTRYRNYNYVPGGESYDAFPSSLVDVLKDYKTSGAPTLYAANPDGYTLPHDEYGVNGLYYPKYESDGTTLKSYTEEIKAIPNPLTKDFPFVQADGTVEDKYKISLNSTDVPTNCSGGYMIIDSTYDLAKGNDTGYYYFTTDDGEGSKVQNGDGAPWVILIDGSRNYRFYFEAGKEFNLWSVVFAVYNVDSNYSPTMFMLGKNTKVNFGGSNTQNTTGLCNAGIISINRKDITGNPTDEQFDAVDTYLSGSDLAEYIRKADSRIYRDGIGYNTTETKTWSEDFKNLAGNTINYSRYYDGKIRPAAYVFGYGASCHLYVNLSAVCEAYVGLYENAWFGGDMLDEKHPTYLYGRIECSNIQMGNSNGAYCMPYCPRPISSDSKPIKRTAGSKYSVSDIKYYYEISATPTPPVGG